MLKDEDQDRRISVSGCLETKTTVSRTRRGGSGRSLWHHFKSRVQSRELWWNV